MLLHLPAILQGKDFKYNPLPVFKEQKWADEALKKILISA